MQAYIVRRLLALIPTLFFASLIVFVTVSGSYIPAWRASHVDPVVALRSE